MRFMRWIYHDNHDTYTHACLRSMRSMRSMRGGFISRSRGPLQKVCHDPARMSGHDCLPGLQTVCFPGGRPHEQNEEVPRMDGSAGRTHTIRTAHTFSLTPRLLLRLLSVDFVPHPPWVKHMHACIPWHAHTLAYSFTKLFAHNTHSTLNPKLGPGRSLRSE
jgi:hypothetical protein